MYIIPLLFNATFYHFFRQLQKTAINNGHTSHFFNLPVSTILKYWRKHWTQTQEMVTIFKIVPESIIAFDLYFNEKMNLFKITEKCNTLSVVKVSIA